MKKIIVNISDIEYEKLKFESMLEKKSIVDNLKQRIFIKPFCEEVENYFNQWMEAELNKIINEE